MLRFPLPSKLVVNIVAFFCIITVLQTLAMSVYFEIQASRTIKRNMENFVATYAQNASDKVDTLVMEIDRMAKILLGNTQIQQALLRANSSHSTDLQRLQDNELMENAIFSFTSLRDSTYIFLADREGNLIVRPGGMEDTSSRNLFDDAYVSARAKVFDKGDFLLVTPGDTGYKSYGGRPAALYIRALRDLQSNEVEAYILVMFGESLLYRTLQAVGLNPGELRVTLLDSSGKQILTCPAPEDGFEGTYSASCVSALTGFTCDVTVGRQALQQNFQERNAAILPLFLAVTAGAILLALYLYVSILKPLTRLLMGMQAVERGDFSVNISLETNSTDMRELIRGFNQMAAKLGRLTQAIVSEKLLFKDAQIAALQYQVNPHFLYNTLQTVEAIAEVRRVPEIQVIAKSMGDLLHYNLHGPSMVTLRLEADHVETYLSIEKIRFPQTFTHVFDIPPEAEECVVPKFIIQPLVENCFVHGLRKKPGEKWIHLFARIQEGVLRITVENNGTPIGPDELERVNARLNAVLPDGGFAGETSSIGLVNVQQRIVHKYGASFGVQIACGQEGTTRVTLTLPEVKRNA